MPTISSSCAGVRREEAREQMQNIMTVLKLTVNEKKTKTCRVARGELRLSGLHDRPVLLDPDWPRLPGDAPGQEAHSAHLRRGQRPNREVNAGNDGDRDGSGSEPQTAWLGQLLLPGPGEQSLPGGGQPCPAWASSMVEAASTRRPDRARGRYPDEYLYEQLGLSGWKSTTGNLPWAKT